MEDIGIFRTKKLAWKIKVFCRENLSVEKKNKVFVGRFLRIFRGKIKLEKLT